MKKETTKDLPFKITPIQISTTTFESLIYNLKDNVRNINFKLKFKNNEEKLKF